ncbi:galactose-3-O-sulfotransferase 2-like isoform X2 [Myxocyprinus asiaticus]|nr:galactose-3-O-sulfotransferase 2-like isoform X2 [Myxocyprinus asiaticus]XP_051534596.1 galactose-3-O-sulfotransferase 2-like isoform X2 [Myxocyprinus asiaticus]XP_051534597.1 galactose-3-O-sulfotransferase 2-like isoform X2 [Myxocyprinus asiaticus]
MLPPQKGAGRERRSFHWWNISPWNTCLRVACCSRLRFMWFTLMVLTVICVALQIFGVVRQARSSKALNLVSEIQRPMKQTEWDNLWYVSAAVVKDPTDQHPFVKRNVIEGRGQVLKSARKKLDTSSPRRLASTLKNKVISNNNPPTTEASPPIEVANKLDQKVVNLFPNVHQPNRPTNPEGTLKKSGPSKIYKAPPSDDVLYYDDKYTVYSQPDNSVMCQPKNHIVFLKTHKTASSTILNILYRYGDSHNLTFALPLNMHSQLFYPAFFAAHFVEGIRTSSVKEFHILCNHMRFNSQEVRKLMPEDTFYFSILRNPVAMMESIFAYYKAIPAFRVVKNLEEFLIQGGRSYNASVLNNHYARNILTFDFGLDSTAPENEEDLDRRSAEIIAAVERDFQLILISEYFDESVVLLKHTLCWTLDDVLSFRLNSRSERSRRPLSPETAERIKAWNSLDWRLYQHFNATFWKRIDAILGRTELQREVELLKAGRKKLEETCLIGGGAVDPAHIHDSSLKPFQYGAAVIQGYNLRLGLNDETRQLCQRLITPELQYTSVLYTKQFPQLAAARVAVSKKIVAARNSVSTHRAVKRNIPIAMTNNTSHNNADIAIRKTIATTYSNS